AASMRRERPARETMLEGLATLYREGAQVQWDKVYPGAVPHVELPHYPWQRQRYWFDQLVGGKARKQGESAGGDHPLLGAAVGVASEAGLPLWNGTWTAEQS